MNKNKLVKLFNNSKERGSISFVAKQEGKFYTKNNLFNPNSIACGKDTVIHDFRYIDWSDITGFVCSRAYKLPYLCHKRPWRDSSYPAGFDHTSFWKKPGDMWPSFCLTEPYGHYTKEEYEDLINQSLKDDGFYNKYNLKFKVIEKSGKSLWCPNATYMIFWWCPDYFNFENHEELLMSHENAEEFEKNVKLKLRKRTKNEQFNSRDDAIFADDGTLLSHSR